MAKVKVKEKIGYGFYTIGDLIEHLQLAVRDNDYLNMDSPVFISDYNMSGYRHKFDVLPTFSPYLKKAGLCLFHSLNEPVMEDDKYEPVEVAEELEEEDVTYDLETETLEDKPVQQTHRGDISRFMKFIKG